MFFTDFIVKQRHIHFVGIGGIGMSGIAEILLNLGYTISGSDIRGSSVTARLASLGARIVEGHRAENIEGADAVVISSAIRDDNPELQAARKAQISVIRRGELLAELMRLKYGIAIAGSHGKTTTTSITAAVLHHSGKDPTVVVGGRVGSLGSNARLGKSDFLLVESDESDGSFLRLAPILAVITNIDREHLDHYGSYEALLDAFVDFANKVPFYGAAILNIDDPEVRKILPRVQRKYRTYGVSADADLIASEIDCSHLGGRFRAAFHEKDLGSFEVRGFGRHNISNAMAAMLVGLELDVPVEVIRQGLRAFSGVDRRFQTRGKRAGVTVIDDRSRPRWRRREHAISSAFTSFFSRTATHGPTPWRKNSGAVSRIATTSTCSTSTPRARRRSRACTLRAWSREYGPQGIRPWSMPPRSTVPWRRRRLPPERVM
jgi:UDP-N-acetylmuramate--alanine ligase